MNEKDRQLGMDRDITRRDFPNGINLAVTGSLLSMPISQAIGRTLANPGCEAAIEQEYRAMQELLNQS